MLSKGNLRCVSLYRQTEANFPSDYFCHALFHLSQKRAGYLGCPFLSEGWEQVTVLRECPGRSNLLTHSQGWDCSPALYPQRCCGEIQTKKRMEVRKLRRPIISQFLQFIRDGGLQRHRRNGFNTGVGLQQSKGAQMLSNFCW